MGPGPAQTGSNRLASTHTDPFAVPRQSANKQYSDASPSRVVKVELRAPSEKTRQPSSRRSGPK